MGEPFVIPAGLKSLAIKSHGLLKDHVTEVRSLLVKSRIWPRFSRRSKPNTPADTGRFFYLGEGRALARLTSGVFLFVDPADETVSAHIIARGFWEAWIHEAICSLLRAGDHVVEVGANVGYYTLEMARLVGPGGSVLALEANPRLTELIAASVAFNGYQNIIDVRQCAAAQITGRLEFITSRSNSGGGHLGLGHGTPGWGQVAIEVESVRLDDIVNKRTRLLRLDAEGSEILILRGAERLLSQPDIIVCMEWDTYQMSSRGDVPALVKWLGDFGFQAWRIDPRGRNSGLTRLTPMLSAIPNADLPSLPACDILLSRSHPFSNN